MYEEDIGDYLISTTKWIPPTPSSSPAPARVLADRTEGTWELSEVWMSNTPQDHQVLKEMTNLVTNKLLRFPCIIMYVKPE